MGAERLFGTDGIRGRASEEPFRPATLARISRAIARVALGGRPDRVAALGNDGRASAPAILDALIPPLLEAGADAVDVGLVTTPGLAHIARNRGFSLGVMISASHNPPGDNGIKLFGSGGEKIPESVEREIERAFEDDLPPRAAQRKGRRRREPSLVHDVVEHLARAAAPGLSLQGVRIVVDCANGGASRIAPAVLARLGAETVALSDVPDGTNINVDCGALHPAALAEEIRRTRADLGVALDGDGDRAVFVDETAEVVPGEAILLGLARDALERGRLARSTLVTTVMSNTALRRAFEAAGGRLEIVAVGDRAVVERLRSGGYTLGGEPSGHVVFGGGEECPGDGIFTALRVVEGLRRRGQRLSAWRLDFRPFPQVLRSVAVRSRPPLESLPAVAEALRRAESLLGREGRVILRYSGTEPLARVLVEGPDASMVASAADSLSCAIRKEIG